MSDFAEPRPTSFPMPFSTNASQTTGQEAAAAILRRVTQRVGPIGPLLMICASVAPTTAVTYRVPDQLPTIQAGINQAAQGDTVLVAPGTYIGPENHNLDFDGRDLVLRSEWGPDHTIIDCRGEGRGFFFRGGETPASLISGFTITDGDPDWVDDYAGAGGGIACFGGSSPTVVNCHVIGNRAWLQGGGIFASGSMTIENCTVRDNRAEYFGGGGVFVGYVGANVKLVNCSIRDNEAENWAGGGVFVYRGTASLHSCTIAGNLAALAGGGLSANYEAILTLQHCTITENSALTGGALDVASTTTALAVDNSILWGNAPNTIHVYPGGPMPQINYSDIQGGWPYGTGNISDDPQFATKLGYPYVLAASSPCIDAASGRQDGLLWSSIHSGYGRWNSAIPDIGRYGGHQLTGAIGGCHFESVVAIEGSIENPAMVLGQPYPGQVPSAWQEHATRIPAGARITLSLGTEVRDEPGPEFYIEEVDEEDGVGVADPYMILVSADGLDWVRLADGRGDSVFDLDGKIDRVRFVQLASYSQEAEIDGLTVFRSGGH